MNGSACALHFDVLEKRRNARAHSENRTGEFTFLQNTRQRNTVNSRNIPANNKTQNTTRQKKKFDSHKDNEDDFSSTHCPCARIIFFCSDLIVQSVLSFSSIVLLLAVIDWFFCVCVCVCVSPELTNLFLEDDSPIWFQKQCRRIPLIFFKTLIEWTRSLVRPSAKLLWSRPK